MPIVKTEASRNEGVEELAEKIAEHRVFIEAEGTLAERRRRNLMNEVVALAAGRLRRAARGAGAGRRPRCRSCSTRWSRGGSTRRVRRRASLERETE